MDKVSIALYVCTFFLYSAHSNLGPFYPEYAAEKGVSQSVIGIIFGYRN